MPKIFFGIIFEIIWEIILKTNFEIIFDIMFGKAWKPVNKEVKERKGKGGGER